MEEKDVLHSVTDAASSAASETVGELTNHLFEFFKTIITWKNVFKFTGVLIVIFALSILFKLAKHGINKIPEEKLKPHHSYVIIKILNYLFKIIIAMYVLSIFGVKFSAIWGAAGIAGVAIGFAAQTSVSNLISGLFVLGEKTMKVGDFIVAGDVSGTIDSVGLLSVKIHTLDNQMIRIPNSSIINSNLQNNSYFNKRRFTFHVSIDYSSDMKIALEALRSVPANCPSVLKDPEPVVWYDGFLDSGIQLVLAVWFVPADLIKMKNEVYIEIKNAFDKAGINIPFNRLDVSLVGDKA